METSLKEYVEAKTRIKLNNDNYNHAENYIDDIFIELYSGGENSAYISKEIYNNGEFDYQIYISVNDGWQVDLKDINLISVSIAKTKEYHSEDNIQKILSSFDITLDNLNTSDIADYGYCASIVNLEVPKDETKQALNYIANCVPIFNSMFGFYMDRPMNRLGHTGWDFLNGNIG